MALLHGIHVGGEWVAGDLGLSLILVVIGVAIGAWLGLKLLDG